MSSTPPFDVQLAVSHLGYLPDSPKTLTLAASDAAALSGGAGIPGAPAEIPFYLRQNCLRMPRDVEPLAGFSERFPAPYQTLRGPLRPREGTYYHRGVLKQVETRWGTFWQADFSDWKTPGSFQIETDWQISVPFAVARSQYDRVLLGYLRFLHAERCGCHVFGVHPACHLDDGILDRDGSPWPVTGGWHDAGDFRKWLFFTLWHLPTLATLIERRGGAMADGGIDRAAILDEIRWGNRFFHGMVTPQGHVYEDVGGGGAPPGSGLNHDEHWWFENHPGFYGDATDNRWTDNVPGSGDERRVRTTYNPFVQFAFAACQARVAHLLTPAENQTCLQLAERAWEYARRRGHDGRTVYLAAELLAAVELASVGCAAVTDAQVADLAGKLLDRQESDASGDGLHGYFLEAGGRDAYRSVAFSADPALALLRLVECAPRLGAAVAAIKGRCRDAVAAYLDGYLLADAASNPFGVTPYGIYGQPEHADRQTFRAAGRGRGVRTFMAPFNRFGMAHGLNSTWMSHAHLLARAADSRQRPGWRAAAERLLHWTHGHNPFNRSTSVAVGFRQPIGYSFRVPQFPEAIMTGCIGWPDDRPYLEASTAIEWNTLEYWSMPYLHAAQAVCYL